MQLLTITERFFSILATRSSSSSTMWKTVKSVSSEVVDTNGSGHGALAGVLSALQVDALICGGIGGGAQTALTDAAIRLYSGISGSADTAAQALAAGTLAGSPAVTCTHRHEGSCENHGCGGL